MVVNGSANVPTVFMGVLGFNIDHRRRLLHGEVGLDAAARRAGARQYRFDGRRRQDDRAQDRDQEPADPAQERRQSTTATSMSRSSRSCKDVNVGPSNYNQNWIDWTDWDGQHTDLQRRRLGRLGRRQRLGLGQQNCSAANHNTWNGCVTDRGTPAPCRRLTTTTSRDIRIEQAGFTVPGRAIRQLPRGDDGPELQLDGDEHAGRLDAAQRQHQPADRPGLGLAVAGRRRAADGAAQAPITPTKDHHSPVGRSEYRGPLVLAARPRSTIACPDRQRLGTCANIKANGITIYTIQVNTGGDPTSTLLKNCASTTDKFFMLTTANQIASTFTAIGTNLTQLRVAK